MGNTIFGFCRLSSADLCEDQCFANPFQCVSSRFWKRLDIVHAGTLHVPFSLTSDFQLSNDRWNSQSCQCSIFRSKPLCLWTPNPNITNREWISAARPQSDRSRNQQSVLRKPKKYNKKPFVRVSGKPIWHLLCESQSVWYFGASWRKTITEQETPSCHTNAFGCIFSDAASMELWSFGLRSVLGKSQ